MAPKTWTVAGLTADLIGVILLAVSASIHTNVLKGGLGAVRPFREPQGRAAHVSRWAARFGWVLLVLGFLGQLIGAALSPN